MERKDYVLAALAASAGATFDSVHIQKLLFLLDEEIAPLIGGKKFNFRPHDYGPFDQDVYHELEQLAAEELVEIDCAAGFALRRYHTTTKGQSKGEAVLKELGSDVSDYMRDLSVWIRKQSFNQLVSFVYAKYPNMKVNSVFRG